MRLRYRLLYMVGLLSLVLTAHAGMRCAGKIINLGDTESTVLSFCGKPSGRHHWFETRTLYQPLDPMHTYTGHKPYPPALLPPEQSIAITTSYSRWTYDRGSSQFIIQLLFQNGILDKITQGGYGHRVGR